MNFQIPRWRFVPRLLVLALIVSAVPLPRAAAQSTQPAGKPGLKASITPIVSAVAARAATSAAKAQAQPGEAKAPLESKSFFKTTAGAVVLAVMAAGTGYALYSAKHDKIPPVQGR